MMTEGIVEAAVEVCITELDLDFDLNISVKHLNLRLTREFECEIAYLSHA